MKDRTEAWLEFVQRYLAAAKKLLPERELANIVLFHCQQAAEKSLKSILEEKDYPVPRIHSVVRLHSIIVNELFIASLADDNDLVEIDSIYIDSRYPAGLGILPSGFPEQEDSKRIYDIAEKIYKRVMDLLIQ